MVKLAWPAWSKERGAVRVPTGEMLVGIDVGHRNVKAVLVSRAGVLEDFRFLPIGGSEEGAKTHQAALKEVVESGIVRGRSIGLLVQGSRVLTRYLELPELAAAELQEAIAIELESVVPYRGDEMIQGFVRGRTLAAAPGRIGVNAMAAPRSLIAAGLGILQQGEPKGLHAEVPSFALVRRLPNTPRAGFVALLDIGARFTHVGMVRDGMVYYARDIPVAGDAFTEAIRFTRDFTFEDAEEMKREEPLLEEASGRSWLEPAVSRWVRELRRTLAYFRTRYPSGPLEVEEVVVSGGGSLMPGLPDYLSGLLSLPVTRLADVPLPTGEGLEVGERRVFLDLAVGLALREAGGAP